MLCYVMLCYVMLCYVMLCYVMLCYVMLCYVMLCYVMLCYVMLCYVMLCYVMLCYVTLHATIIDSHSMVMLGKLQDYIFTKSTATWLVKHFLHFLSNLSYCQVNNMGSMKLQRSISDQLRICWGNNTINVCCWYIAKKGKV